MWARIPGLWRGSYTYLCMECVSLHLDVVLGLASSTARRTNKHRRPVNAGGSVLYILLDLNYSRKLFIHIFTLYPT